MISYPYIEQLFRNVLQQSKVVEGRFFVCPNAGAEINSDGLGQLAADALGSEQQKYPCCLMMPPRSVVELQANEVNWERFRITLFFLRTSFHDNGDMAMPDPGTLTSARPVLEDWADMKLVATDFLRVLDKTVRKHMLQANTFRIVPGRWPVVPISKVGNDQASGVRIDFDVEVFAGCDIVDYENNVNITLPNTSA